MDTDHTKDERDCVTTTDPKEMLKCALDEMEKGSALPLEKGLREKIGDKAFKKFDAQKKDWPHTAEKVLRAARQIGEYAEEFARFEAEMKEEQPTVVTLKHANHAIAVVKDLCNARKLKWCPDPV
jgi:hypothetical protein